MWPILFVGLSFYGCDSQNVQCKNEQSLPVDWYIIYKYPEQHWRKGLAYVYIDDETIRNNNNNNYPHLIVVNNINSFTGTLANTLQPYFNNVNNRDPNAGFLLYNDQPPNGGGGTNYGHSKGVIMWDQQTGVWLSHSTPSFPEGNTANSFWPNSGTRYAQTFLCVTVNYNQLQNIGHQLQFIHPKVFQQSILPPELANFNQYPRNPPFWSDQLLTSRGGMQFHSYAKYGRMKADLYCAVVADQLGTDLFVKTWRIGAGQPNQNAAHQVDDVINVRLDDVHTFFHTVDHSKWCITQNANIHVTCIGDMNREASQFRRSGGVICTDNIFVFNIFNAFRA